MAKVAENNRRRPAEVRIRDPKAGQRKDERRKEAAERRPKQAPVSPEFLRMKRIIDRSVVAYFLAHLVYCKIFQS